VWVFVGVSLEGGELGVVRSWGSLRSWMVQRRRVRPERVCERPGL
jgi:hypothetical protein